jgi:tetratricopeptide (TPR) repeat protein
MLLASPTALAEDEAQRVAFSEGRYHEAVLLSATMPTADNLAFSARSLLAEAVSAPNYAPPPHLLDEAEAKAREAMALDPDHVEARLQLAIALSLKARPLSTRAAMRTGYGEEAKQLADAALRDEPENKYAHGFLAVWHLEVRRRGGAIGGSIMGASVRKARNHYQAAIQSAPDDASIHWQYARALTALNAKRHQDEIQTVLSTALDCQTETQLEGVMKQRAELLGAMLDQKSWKSAQQAAAQML